MKLLTLNTELKSALLSNTLFASCGEECRERAAEGAEILAFDTGETVLSEGMQRQALGLVLSGRLKVWRAEQSGRVLLNTIEAGGCFGVSTMFSPGKPSCTEVAAAESSRCAFLPEERLIALMRCDEAFMTSYVAFLTGRIRFLNSRIRAFTAPDAEEKLLCYLRSRQPDAPVPTLADLARRLDMGRASLYRALDRLESSGAIKRTGKNITLMD